MQTIFISKLPYLAKNEQLEELNRLVSIHESLMPHQIAIATGCSQEEALVLLLTLNHKMIMDGFLLVYHNIHIIDNPPFMARRIMDGFPELPTTCDVCGVEIKDSFELSYDFLFKFLERVEFKG